MDFRICTFFFYLYLMTEKQTEQYLYMQLIEEDCYIDTKEKIDYPPVALSYGEQLIKSRSGDKLLPIPICSYGNIISLAAPPKTKKSFFISLLASVFLSGSNMYGGQLKGHRGNGNCVHIDTEQSRWHSQNCFSRPFSMDYNTDVSKYNTFALRTIPFKDRMNFLEYYLSKLTEPSLVCLDGVADMVGDVNDLISCNACVQKLMEISEKYNCAIICVIHNNFGTSKMTGHLGSALAKKSETIIELEQNTVNKDWITVHCKQSRNYAFDTFSFEVNDYGLPLVVDDLYDPLKSNG